MAEAQIRTINILLTIILYYHAQVYASRKTQVRLDIYKHKFVQVGIIVNMTRMRICILYS